jgi:ankyrin repeat protein
VTPGATAARFNKKDVFEYLIQRGANASIQGDFGHTAWDEAKRFLNDRQIQEMRATTDLV